ncbi:MAG TPA: HDOD domain-containing protein [Rhodocyclaceae bacterium]|nr:HDOD domain-containing protein [Rhodocyclaceae bacterium]
MPLAFKAQATYQAPRNQTQMITSPFPDLDSWVMYFRSADIPVLRHTVTELDKLREKADSVNARTVSGVILSDPLMTLRVLAYIEKHRSKSQTTDITTIERALMMIGMGPFFRAFEHMPLVEEELAAHPKALLGLLKVIQRARRASTWAREWGLMRKDLDVDEITVAALLHDTAELLMWCFAPTLALNVREMQVADKHMRSSAAQEAIYGINLHDLQIDLALAWHLPKLLTTLMDHSDGENSHREQNVKLAVDLARHSANGWDDAALPDDYKGICELLHISHETLYKKLGIDAPPAAE